MYEYEIVYAPIKLADGSNKDKWNIVYYIDGCVETTEFYSYDGIIPVVKIRDGYSKKTTS